MGTILIIIAVVLLFKFNKKITALIEKYPLASLFIVLIATGAGLYNLMFIIVCALILIKIIGGNTNG